MPSVATTSFRPLTVRVVERLAEDGAQLVADDRVTKGEERGQVVDASARSWPAACRVVVRGGDVQYVVAQLVDHPKAPSDSLSASVSAGPCWAVMAPLDNSKRAASGLASMAS